MTYQKVTNAKYRKYFYSHVPLLAGQSDIGWRAKVHLVLSQAPQKLLKEAPVDHRVLVDMVGLAIADHDEKDKYYRRSFHLSRFFEDDCNQASA